VFDYAGSSSGGAGTVGVCAGGTMAVAGRLRRDNATIATIRAANASNEATPAAPRV
jgi:hypothetical protein